MQQVHQQQLPPNPALERIWHEHHRYLLDVAYRMLGSVSEAEDIVQDAFTKLLGVDPQTIQDMRAWLVVAVTRRCLDQLRSARARKEVYVGPWLPEPVIAATAESDPAERVTLDDSVRMALLIVLEHLTPAERVVFVLHDVFAFSFEDIGKIVGKTPAASRQLASRARRRIRPRTSPARFQVDQDELVRVSTQFAAAASSGNVDALMAMLDPDVVAHTDTGGMVPAQHGPLTGRKIVATSAAHFLQNRQLRVVPMPINAGPGLLLYRDEDLYAVVALELRDGLVTHVHAIANRHKLAHVSSILNTPLAPVNEGWQKRNPVTAD